jgi:threonine dehydrogenase-like Zn-dependent dehydrogenase
MEVTLEEQMKALTVIPGTANSAQIEDVPEPPLSDGSVLVKTIAVGVCGTDHEIISGEYGWPPDGSKRLIIGHESLGYVEDAPPETGFHKGDLVVGIVRRPDPVPCVACAVGEWDMCRNGLYTERGIKQRDGYCSERFRIEPEFLVHMDPALGELAVLLEPTTVVAKAWDHVERIGARALWRPQTVLITGAGPIGLLAALLGKQRGLDVHVLDIVKKGAKPDLVRELGATYHTGPIDKLSFQPDIVIECAGVAQIIVAALNNLAKDGVLCLAGVSPAGRQIPVDVGAINRSMVLDNNVMFGSVNANRRHFEAGAEALKKADKNWLGKLITRREPLENWAHAIARQPDDIKVIIQFAAI